MDLYFNLFMVVVIVFFFIVLKYTLNPYVYIGIIMFAVTGLVISIIDPLYIVTGTNNSFVMNGTIVIGEIITPIKESLDNYNYIFQLFYLMSMIGSVVYWSIDNPRRED